MYLGTCVLDCMSFGCRILFCGPKRGKSLILSDWLGGRWESPTICFDERRATFCFDGTRCDCLILDLSGKDYYWRFQEILVSDIDILVLFDDTMNWFHRVYPCSEPSIVLVVSEKKLQDVVDGIRNHVKSCKRVHPQRFKSKIKKAIHLFLKSKMNNAKQVYNADTSL